MLKFGLFTTVLLLITSVAYSQTSLNQQLIFQDRAGTGSGTFNGSTTPFGFWIWCQPVSSNAYGNDCTGSVYFYRLGITVGAAGHVASFQQSGDTLAFTVTVSSVPNGSKISNCIFSFSGTPTEGASNTVTLTCDKPTGTGTDSKVSIQLAPPA
jgi:hypothetical protein